MKLYCKTLNLSAILLVALFLTIANNLNSQGHIQANTNPVLPSSYNFQEYVFAEPNDQGNCPGMINNTAIIEDIFVSQTHRHAIGHPFLFTIGERPAFFQIALTGSGQSPDVQVEGMLNGTSLGTLCLAGPANLSATIDFSTPNFEDYFSVTLPKSWIKIGLELRITTGNQTQVLTQDDLKIRPYSELNLVNVDMDLLDYNHLPHRTPIFDDFLEELASAIPVSVIRFGQFPETIKMPVIGINNWQGTPGVFSSDSELDDTNFDRSHMNAAAHDLLGAVQQASGDFANTIFFGNTLNLDPGGWGVEGNFVGYEYTDVFIHELGHAFGLPHWEWEYNVTNPGPDSQNYPYSGETSDGGGRGHAWNFIQDTYEFVSPSCEDQSGSLGLERSDCMQREHPCVETRPSGPGPWDGFGDFSAIAISDFFLGTSEVVAGQVAYRGNMVDYQRKENPGYPRVSLQNGQRSFTREPSQPQNTFIEDYIKLPGTERVEQDVFLISGSTHVSNASFNIIYDPIPYRGILLPVIDPTDPIMFTTLQNLDFEDAPELYDQERDVTLRLTYADGTISHVLVPFRNSDRLNPDDPSELVSLRHFSVVVPGDQALCNVKLFRREFIISNPDNPTSGNINDPSQNITATNFMDNAVLMSTLDHSCNCPGTPGYIEPGTSCDDGNPYTINDVEDGYCNCAGTVIPTCGLITNSAFTQTLSGWRWWGCDPASVNDEAAISIVNEFDTGFGFDILSLDAGETYTVRFEAYATENRPLNLLHQAEYDFENDQEGPQFLNATFDITTTKTQYEVTYPITANGNYSLLEFNFSGNAAGLFIDNVCLDIACDIATDPNCDNGDQVLPVDFISFIAAVESNTVELDWTTGTEINLSHYVVQRADASDILTFVDLGEVTADGSGVYSFVDINPFVGQNYYRIIAIDFDGSEHISNTITINMANGGPLDVDVLLEADAITLFPNPTAGIFEISGPMDDYTIRILNTDGSLVDTINYTGLSYEIDISALPSGLLFIQIQHTVNGSTSLQKIIKQ